MKKTIGTQHALQSNLYIVNQTSNIPVSAGGLSNRGRVSYFSESSGRRMRKFLRTCVPEYKVFITLTYPSGRGGDGDGERCKEELKRFLQEYRRYSIRHGADPVRWSAFWFMEFQKRGVIHYHIFGTDFIGKNALSEMWYRICGTEDKRHLASGTNVESLRAGRNGTVSYASKYANKAEQKEIPESFGWAGRFWGVSGCRVTVSPDIYVEAGLAGEGKVKTRLEKIKEALKAGLEAGTIKKLQKGNNEPWNGSAVYVLTTTKVRQQFERLMYLLICDVTIQSGKAIERFNDAVNLGDVE